MSSRKDDGSSNNPPLEQIEELLTDSDDDQLPSGWDMRVTEKGRVFYIRSVSKYLSLSLLNLLVGCNTFLSNYISDIVD